MGLLQGPLAPFWDACGIVVEVYLDAQDAAFHVRAPYSDHPAWRCAFPYPLRTAAGVRYLVEELHATRRGYWRAVGRI